MNYKQKSELLNKIKNININIHNHIILKGKHNKDILYMLNINKILELTANKTIFSIDSIKALINNEYDKIKPELDTTKETQEHNRALLTKYINKLMIKIKRIQNYNLIIKI